MTLFFRVKEILEAAESADSSHLSSDVVTVTLTHPAAISRESLEAFVHKILWEDGAEGENGTKSKIIRMKVRHLSADDFPLSETQV